MSYNFKNISAQSKYLGLPAAVRGIRRHNLDTVDGETPNNPRNLRSEILDVLRERLEMLDPKRTKTFSEIQLFSSMLVNQIAEVCTCSFCLHINL